MGDRHQSPAARLVFFVLCCNIKKVVPFCHRGAAINRVANATDLLAFHVENTASRRKFATMRFGNVGTCMICPSVTL